MQWFWSPRRENLSLFYFSSSICHKVMGPDAMILAFWILSFKLAFSLSSFTLNERLFISPLLSASSGIIAISEVVEISHSKPDSSLWFIWPSILHDVHCIYSLEKEMATHSSTLAWRIPWKEEPGRLQSMGSQSQTWLRDFTTTTLHIT